MKILLATSGTSLRGGGIATYNLELRRCLVSHNILCLLTDANESHVEGYNEIYSTYGYCMNDYSYVKRLINKINAAQYDCIINSASAFLPIIAPFINVPIVSISHFVNGRLAHNAGYNAEFLNAIVALSWYGKRFLEKCFRISDTYKVHVVYNSVQIETLRYPLKGKQRPLRIVFPGGTSTQKSIDVVQKLIYKLIQSDLKFEFIWIGGMTLPSTKVTLFGLHSIPDLFHTDNRLRILGCVSRDKAVDLISSANIFLLPSRGEGCPMSLLEAMREGCIPIVSNAHHGSRELLQNSRIGFILQQGSSQEIFDCIAQIIQNPEKYESMYVTSREYVSNELSATEWIRSMQSIIEDAIILPKKTIPITKIAFYKSKIGYIRLLYYDRFFEIILSAYCRIKIEWNYLIAKNFIAELRNKNGCK